MQCTNGLRSVDAASYLGKLFAHTVGKSPDEIAKYLEQDDEVRMSGLVVIPFDGVVDGA